ncbi:MAG: hypothetical protein Q9195_006547 [Heterodermia aff. obscurata]
MAVFNILRPQVNPLSTDEFSTSFEHTPGVLKSPLCYKCNVWARLNQFWWSPKSYEYVYAIHQVIITIKEGNPATTTSTYFNSLSTFDLDEDWDSTVVDETTGASGVVFPTGILAWYGFHGTRTCYPPASAAFYSGGPFSKAMAGKKAEYIEMIGTRTTALDPVPMHNWKTHFGIQSCTASGAPGGGSFSAGQSLSYVRVTYLTKSSTVTATNGESVPTPIFPTTNGVESTISQGINASAAISSSVDAPTGLLNTSQTAIADDTDSDEFDAADWVDANMPSIGPSLSSRCSSYAESAFTHKFLATATINSAASLNATHAPYTGPKFSSPCCGNCYITIPSVEVLYWPTPAVPGISTIVSSGYTFRSPSVYIDFVTARAGNACGNPGNYSSRVTLAFAPDELRTLHNNAGKTRHGQIERPFNFADFNTLNCDQHIDGGISALEAVLLLDAGLITEMLTLLGQKYDPPRALTTVAALGPTTTATPRPSITPAKPSAIPEVVPVQTAKPKVNSVPHFIPVNPNPDLSGVSDPMDDIGQDGDSTPKGSGNSNHGSKPVAGTHADAGSSRQDAEPEAGSSDPEDQDSTISHLEHKYSSVDVGGIGIYLPTQGQKSVVLGHQTASVGGPAVTIAHTPVSLGPSYLIIDGTHSHRLLPTAHLPRPSIVTIGTHRVAIPTNGASTLAIGSQTASVGGPRITVGNVPVSLAPSHLVVGTHSHRLLATAHPTNPSVIAVGGYNIPIPAYGASSIVVGSQTASVGGPRITVSDVPISLAPSHLMVGSTSYALPITSGSAKPTSVDIAGYSFAVPSPGVGAITIGSQVVSANGPAITISNTPVSLGDHVLVVGSSTHLLAFPQPTMAAPITIGGYQIIPPGPGSSLVIGTHTLTPGQGITISATPISLGSSVLAIGTSTIPLPTAGPDQINVKQPHYFAIGSQTIAIKPAGIVVGSQTLRPGGPAITVSGTLYSLGTTEFIAGSLTETFPAAAKPSQFRPSVVMSGLSQIGASSLHDIITVGDETIKLNPSNIVVHGTTLTPGGSGITIDGTVISLGTDELVIGSKTETFSNLSAAESTAPGGLGEVIMSAFGQIGATTTADSDQGVPSGSAGVGTGNPTAAETAFKGSGVRSIVLGGVALLASWCFGLAALMFL